ncbi:hypothetical protein [Aliikangiella sp. G2MR2-5]|uniref:HzsA-related protein n=1 Tax=Aliikangiella sp. G2MR2-5 TaxID=2788943 RepID=UPI0018AA4CEE|nr:hypothetical protein [Aliikangiella sp. G2MR2-5]
MKISEVDLKLKRFGPFCALLVAFLSGCGQQSGSEQGGQDADPVVVDFPIAFVTRPLPQEMDDAGNSTPIPSDLREPIGFNPGAQLMLKDRATPSASEVDITSSAFDEGALYDVKDVEVSFDGLKLVFAMRAPEIEGVDDDEQPTWNIWEYDRATQTLRRIIDSDITAEEGQDVAPHYLPDGRIVFASTRQRLAKAVLLDEGKPQYAGLDEDRNVEALALHVMNDDGSEIKQITFNQSHDTDPTVLSNGKIVFSRWDNYSRDSINLYQVNPDGSNLEILYGIESHNTGSDDSVIDFVNPREAEDGRLLVQIRPNSTTHYGGELVYIDWENFIDINQTTVPATGMAGPGQVSATPFDVRTDEEPSSGGRFASVYPLYDGSGRTLISWTQCRLNAVDEDDNPIIIPCTEEALAEPDVEEAQPLYGIWIYDPQDGTQLPIVTPVEGMIAHEVVAMGPRDLPAVIQDIEFSAEVELVEENMGVVHIRSVYDFDGVDTSPNGISMLADPAQTLAANRPARFIRIVKPVSMPDDDLVDLDGADFGRSQAELMRDIVGYTMVEPDGSAMFKVPADIAFSLSVLDANGRRIGGRHSNWMSVKAGEVKQCNGCHTRDSSLPHGRLDAQAQSINAGATSTGAPFPNTNPDLFADEGETMAEVWSRLNGIRDLSLDIRFDDVWTDPAVRTPDESFSYSYSDLLTPAPTDIGCVTEWAGRCRITINYLDTIQPLWELSREVTDGMGNLIQDNTCTGCHSNQDSMGQTQVPVAQLELVSTPSVDEPDQITSYRELLFPDNIQELVDGVLVDQLVQATDGDGNPVYETDADGNLILDANGDPIPVMVPITTQAIMNVASATANQRFFQLFDAGGSHQGWLTPAELKLIAEWLDIGGQYYNNPFDVPQ